MYEICFRGENSDRFTLTIHGRNIPDATDYWQGNFPWCTADIVAGVFRGTTNSTIRNEDLIRFLHDLEKYGPSYQGLMIFDSVDGWFDIRLTRENDDRIVVEGQLCEKMVSVNMLEFKTVINGSSIQSLLDQVRAAVAAFPVLGNPSDVLSPTDA